MSIISFLQSKKVDQSTVNPRKKEGLNYLGAFFKQNEGNDLKILSDYSLSDLALIYFCSLAPECLEESTYMVNKYQSLFTRNNLEVLRIILYLSTDNDFLAAYYSSNLNAASLNSTTLKISGKYQFGAMGSIKFLIRFLLRVNDFKEFVNFFKNISFKTQNATDLVTVLYTAEDIQKTFQSFGHGELTNKSIKKTEKRIGKVAQSYSILHDSYLERCREYAKEIREVNKYNNSLEKIMLILQRNPRYITPSIMDDILSQKIDTSIKTAIVDYIYSINSKNESIIARNYEQAKSSTKESLKKLLDSYNIDYSSLSKEEFTALQNLSNLKLKEILDFFLKYQIPISNIADLIYLDSEVIEEIGKLLINGVLTPKFISEHVKILERDNPIYKQIIINLGLLSSMEINIRNYPNSLDILLTDLSYPLFIISKYKINITNKTKDITFLALDHLEEKLDLLLETGTDINTLASYDILNYSLEQLYGYIISSSLDIDYSSSVFDYFKKEALVPNPSLMIPRSYIFFFASNKESTAIPENLKCYIVSPNILIINGVYVSLNRLSKNLSCIDITNTHEVFYALLYGSHYNLKEVKLLQEEIYSPKRSLQ